VAGSCEHGKKLSVSIQDREFIYRLSDYQLLKEDFVPFNST
jgi:hypothetical protein